MKRMLEEPIRKDLKEKIVLLSGPRQVGKTTLARQLDPGAVYLNFDAAEDRAILKKQEWPRSAPLIIFDELHKMKGWKSYIKGIYDTQGVSPGLLVTGSARLETYRKGGDSLAGRFLAHRLHPLTVKELCKVQSAKPADALERLLKFGGFPEPFLKADETFARRWRRSLADAVLRQDLLDLESVRDLKSIELLLDLIRSRVGSRFSYASAQRDLQVSIPTVRRWLQILENLFLIFPVRPYHKNIARSLLKEAKYYLFDAGAVAGEPSARLENLVALALLRELNAMEDELGHSASLHYLRDKEKREVDFLAVVDQKPVLMVEVKWGDDSFSPSLAHFHRFLPKTKAVQVVHQLKRRKSSGALDMLACDEFLAGMDIMPT